MDKAKKIGVKIFVYAVMIFTIIISIFPIIWVIMSAFKTNAADSFQSVLPADSYQF